MPLLKIRFPSIGNVHKPLAKSVFNTITINSSSISNRTVIHEKMFGSGNTTLIISNEEMNDVMKIVKTLELSGLLI